MAEEIRWDVFALDQKLEVLTQGLFEVGNIPEVTYDLSEGMRVMEEFDRVRKIIEEITHRYIQIVGTDIGNIYLAAKAFGEADETISQTLEEVMRRRHG